MSFSISTNEFSSIKSQLKTEVESAKNEVKSEFDFAFQISKFDFVVNSSTDTSTEEYSSIVSETVPTYPLQTNNFSFDTVNYTDIIQEMSVKYNVSSKLIHSVIQAESSFDPNAVSPVGAQGLMQLMPETAQHLGVKDSFDPKQNIEGGAKYLREMLDRFDGNITHAVAAYNAGPGSVEKYGGVPPYEETQNYVKKVLKINN